MASLKTTINGRDRLKAIWAMISHRPIEIFFDDKLIMDAVVKNISNQIEGGK